MRSGAIMRSRCSLTSGLSVDESNDSARASRRRPPMACQRPQIQPLRQLGEGVHAENGASGHSVGALLVSRVAFPVPTSPSVSKTVVQSTRRSCIGPTARPAGEQSTPREGMKRIGLHSLAASTRHLDRPGIRFTASPLPQIHPRRHASRLLYTRSYSQGRHCSPLRARKCGCS